MNRVPGRALPGLVSVWIHSKLEGCTADLLIEKSASKEYILPKNSIVLELLLAYRTGVRIAVAPWRSRKTLVRVYRDVYTRS